MVFVRNSPMISLLAPISFIICMDCTSSMPAFMESARVRCFSDSRAEMEPKKLITQGRSVGLNTTP